MSRHTTLEKPNYGADTDELCSCCWMLFRRLNSTKGRTKCVNTFTGYTCECGEGFMKVVDKATSVDSCAEINECLVSSVPFTKEDCKCERCACVNTVGSYK